MSLTPVIAGQGSRAYLPAMSATLIRLLALVALVLMPLGMTATATAAHSGPTVGAAEDCTDHGSEQQAPMEQAIDCTVTCAALPAFSAPFSAALEFRGAETMLPILLAISGAGPDTETPPPKLS